MENNVVIIPGMETVAMLLSNHQLQYGKTGVVTQEDIIFFKHILNSTLKQYCFGGLGGTLVNISTSCKTQKEKEQNERNFKFTGILYSSSFAYDEDIENRNDLPKYDVMSKIYADFSKEKALCVNAYGEHAGLYSGILFREVLSNAQMDNYRELVIASIKELNVSDKDALKRWAKGEFSEEERRDIDAICEVMYRKDAFIFWTQNPRMLDQWTAENANEMITIAKNKIINALKKGYPEIDIDKANHAIDVSVEKFETYNFLSKNFELVSRLRTVASKEKNK